MDTSNKKLKVIKSFPLVLIPANIMAVFKHSWIFTLNPEIFTDSYFMLFYFFGRPIPASPNLGSTNNPQTISNFPEQSSIPPALPQKKLLKASNLFYTNKG